MLGIVYLEPCLLGFLDSNNESDAGADLTSSQNDSQLSQAEDSEKKLEMNEILLYMLHEQFSVVHIFSSLHLYHITCRTCLVNFEYICQLYVLIIICKWYFKVVKNKKEKVPSHP